MNVNRFWELIQALKIAKERLDMGVTTEQETINKLIDELLEGLKCTND